MIDKWNNINMFLNHIFDLYDTWNINSFFNLLIYYSEIVCAFHYINLCVKYSYNFINNFYFLQKMCNYERCFCNMMN